MKKFVYLFLIPVLLFSSIPVFSQIPEVPEGFTFRTSRDYLEKQDLVVSCILWLQQNHPEDYEPRRKEMNRFVSSWLSGAPGLSIKTNDAFYQEILSEKAYPFAEDLGKVYLYSKALHVMSRPGSKDDNTAKMAGTEEMLKLYKVIIDNDPTNSSKVLDKYLKLQEKAKLSAYIAKNG